MTPQNSDKEAQNLHPADIVNLLDQYIVGQQDAKKAVAIAVRNRWRRLQVGDLKEEISPKNILMIGPTGVGKTEIARRISSITQAPFIKVEATKFTEVGYVGRDVDSIIRDLLTQSINIMREKAMVDVEDEATLAVEEIILNALMPKPEIKEGELTTKTNTSPNSEAREIFRKKLRAGELDNRMIDIDLRGNIGIEIMTPAGMEDMTSQLQHLFQNLPQDKNRTKKMKVSEAQAALLNEQAQQLVNEEKIRQDAIKNVEENGIVFLDEIDKVVKPSGHGGDVSREGVQRDLLPLIEGTTIQTKHGSVKTDHILFIASGAFMGCKPADMISELQGRLPIRVELKPLSSADFVRILKEPKASLIKQYQALLKTEQVTLEFTDDGISRIADIAYHYNEKTDNIGARRLHTIMEKLLEDISYTAPNLAGKTITIDEHYVSKHLKSIHADDDLSQWIL
ncbi:MAG: ATP-dependent protease ATPase subunit HslU [Pseudomonadota bacterium]|nr:ATP-dependent protease ATPase subunit HslU [Pseudomonadota bacterium]